MRLIGVLFGLSLLAGCAPAERGDAEQQLAFRTVVRIDEITRAAALSAISLDALRDPQPPATPTYPGMILAEGLPKRFVPPSCVSGNPNGTFLFGKCAGPFGLQTIDGTLRYTSIGESSVDFMGQRLQIAAGVVLVQASVSAVEGTDRAAQLRSMDFYPLQLSWDAACITLSGSYTDSQGLTLIFTNYRQCDSRCPEAGSAVEARPSAVPPFYFEFDGTPRARYRHAFPAEAEPIALPCGK